jgi:hypothetical protein
MKYLLLFASVVLAALGLTLSLVSALRYGALFAAVLLVDLLAGWCLWRLAQFGVAWRVFAILVGLLVLYSAVDVCLRALFGLRVLDMFQ